MCVTLYCLGSKLSGAIAKPFCGLHDFWLYTPVHRWSLTKCTYLMLTLIQNNIVKQASLLILGRHILIEMIWSGEDNIHTQTFLLKMWKSYVDTSPPPMIHPDGECWILDFPQVLSAGVCSGLNGITFGISVSLMHLLSTLSCIKC